jgi:hypothetical protein
MILIVPQGIPSELLSLFFSPIVVLKHLYFRGRGPCCKARE